MVIIIIMIKINTVLEQFVYYNTDRIIGLMLRSSFKPTRYFYRWSLYRFIGTFF